MGKDSKSKLHVEIGIDGISNSIVRLSGNYRDLTIAACYIINAFYRMFEKRGDGDRFRRDIRELMTEDSSVLWTVGGPTDGKG